MEGDWIVQEWVDSRPYWFAGPDGEGARLDLVWGLYVFGGRFGGLFLRSAAAAHGIIEIINTQRGARVVMPLVARR